VPSLERASTWKQARIRKFGSSRFQQPQGWISSAKEEILMFDNEIDWVTQIGYPHVRREARSVVKVSEERIHTRPSTSNELVITQASVQSKKSVFRSCSSNMREHGRVTLRRITGNNLTDRTEVIRLPALELILWSSY